MCLLPRVARTSAHLWVEDEQNYRFGCTLSLFKLFTCTCIACMDGGYSQGGGGRVPPPASPLNETLPAGIVEINLQHSFHQTTIAY